MVERAHGVMHASWSRAGNVHSRRAHACELRMSAVPDEDECNALQLPGQSVPHSGDMPSATWLKVRLHICGI